MHRIVRHAAAVILICAGPLAAAEVRDPGLENAVETPESMVAALHTAFGEHHARAVHTKGIIVEGSFTPSKEARTLVKTPIFAGGVLPVTARFSLFAGVPTLPDNDDGASPAGFAFKIRAKDGNDFDVEANQHPDFITSTFDEFAVFLRAVGATKPDTPHPNPVEQFLATHPHAVQFLQSRTYPVSYAQAKYFGINAFKFTNSAGKSAFVRYQFEPRAGETYLTPEQRKAKSATYLQDELVARLKTGPLVLDWYAQIAEAGDKVEDPAVAWPATRRRVKLGTFTLAKLPADPDTAQRQLLFLPGQDHPGVAAADPMLVLRNLAYPISFGERQ